MPDTSSGSTENSKGPVSFQEQLLAIAPKVPKSPEVPVTNSIVNDSKLKVTTSVGETTIPLTPQQQEQFIKNALDLQRAAILEKKTASWVNVGMLVFTAATTVGAVWGYTHKKI